MATPETTIGPMQRRLEAADKLLLALRELYPTPRAAVDAFDLILHSELLYHLSWEEVFRQRASRRRSQAFLPTVLPSRWKRWKRALIGGVEGSAIFEQGAELRVVLLAVPNDSQYLDPHKPASRKEQRGLT